MPKVYIPIDSGHNYASAVDKGEIVFLFSTPINVFAIDKLVNDIGNKLSHAKEEDFFLPSGNAIANCIVFSMLIRKFKKVNFLIYSFRDNTYEVRTVWNTKFEELEVL